MTRPGLNFGGSAARHASPQANQTNMYATQQSTPADRHRIVLPMLGNLCFFLVPTVLRGNASSATLRVAPTDTERRKRRVPTQSMGTRERGGSTIATPTCGVGTSLLAEHDRLLEIFRRHAFAHNVYRRAVGRDRCTPSDGRPGRAPATSRWSSCSGFDSSAPAGTRQCPRVRLPSLNR